MDPVAGQRTGDAKPEKVRPPKSVASGKSPAAAPEGRSLEEDVQRPERP